MPKFDKSTGYKMKGHSLPGPNQIKSPAKLVGTALVGASHLVSGAQARLVDEVQVRAPERKERRDLKSKIKTQKLKTELETSKKGERDVERKPSLKSGGGKGKGN